MANASGPNQSNAIASAAPLLVGGVLMIALTAVFIGLIFSVFSQLRFLGLGGAFNVAGLRSLSTGETVYVTFYYPGWKTGDSVEGNCENYSGVKYAYRNISSQEIISYCGLPDSEKKNYQTDSNYELVSSFEGGNYAVGGIAVNNPSYWPNGAAWPISTQVNAQVRKGTTFWLQIPGYTSQPAPVIDTFGTATYVHKNRYEELRARGQDLKKRLDLAVKGPDDEKAALSRMNCEGGVAGVYSCKVSGVSVFHGNAFTGNLSEVGGPGGTGGNATADEGAFTGDFTVDQSLAIPDKYVGDPGMNTVYAKPTYIVLHYLATTGMDAKKAQEYFVNTLKDTDPDNNKYVQFTINQDGTIHQFLPETKKSAGACGFNAPKTGGISISIENEGHFESGVASQNFTATQLASNIKLVKYLQEKWNISNDHVISHGDAWKLGYDSGFRLYNPKTKKNDLPCDDRSDPGTAFMTAIRTQLNKQ